MTIGEKMIWANAFVSYLEKHGNEDCAIVNSEIAAEYAATILRQFRETLDKFKEDGDKYQFVPDIVNMGS